MPLTQLEPYMVDTAETFTFANTNIGNITASNIAGAGSLTSLTVSGNLSLTNVSNLRITGGSSGQFISTDGIGNLSFSTPATSDTYQATASGTLSDGTKVIVNSDGTVSAISAIASSVGTGDTVSTGSITNQPVSAVDPINQKIVIVYRLSSTLVNAVAGTISGTNITFGSPTQLFGGVPNTELRIVYVSSNKFFVAGINSSSFLNGQVLTISGTTITGGTAVAANGNVSTGTMLAYDSDKQKIVVGCFVSSTWSCYVGTISGTSITFGSARTIVSQFTLSTSFADPRLIYNPKTLSIVFLAYTTTQSPTYTIISNVGTINTSNNTVSFALLYNSVQYYTTSGNEILSTSVTYDPYSRNIVYFFFVKGQGYTYIYGDGRSWSAFNILDGIYSGNNAPFIAVSAAEAGSNPGITFVYSDGTYTSNRYYVTVVLNNNSTTTMTSINNIANGDFQYLSVNMVGTKFVIWSTPSSTSIQATVVQTASTTLTSTNYIGISNGNYTNEQTATIQTAGAVDDAQSGLTAGSAYYIQNNGTLSTTPGNPSVFAGTAVSSTKLIVKG